MEKEKEEKKAGTTISQDVRSGEDFTIYKDEGITEEDDNEDSKVAKKNHR